MIEAENALGYHSSGRSATFYHFGIGNRPVRAMTAYSRAFLERPPEGFSEVPLCRPAPALFVANRNMVTALAELKEEMARVTDTVSDVDTEEMRALCPALKFGSDAVVAGVVDIGGRKLDPDALLHGYARKVRNNGGEVVLGSPLISLKRGNGAWIAQSQNGSEYTAPIVVNAAGAWADRVAQLADIAPLGLRPLRRTIITFDPPAGETVHDWPFVKTAVDDFYMLPESGRLMASPVDEVESEPSDAQPEDYDVALAAWKVEEWTTMRVQRIAHKWAGLRSFVSDRVPTAGFATDAEGFFWLAGQGGYGLQTAPAMADITAALVCGAPWPLELSLLGVTAETVGPERLRR
jgi:D-arginine dehydrogenase